MVGWHHQLNEHEFEQVLGVGDGQGCLVCCSPWGSNNSDTTELSWMAWLLFLRNSESIITLSEDITSG